MKLQDNVFANSGTNPFDGDIEKGIQYDLYEAQGFVVDQSAAFPRPKGIYEHGADQLLQYFNPKAQHVLELGSGTGIATRSLLRQNNTRQVVGVEVSPGMREVSLYKFHQKDAKRFEEEIEQYYSCRQGEQILRELREYWDQFREETLPVQTQVNFLIGDIQNIAELVNHDAFDGATANQVLHWVDISRTFAGLHQVLKKGAAVIWNSASHFYDDEQYPAERWGFRYHRFMEDVTKELRRCDLEVVDYRSIQRPLQNLASITKLTEERGFSTEQVGTLLLPVDFQAMLTKQVPRLAAAAIQNDLSLDKKQAYIDEAIFKAFRENGFPEDKYHKYDIVPIFSSVKQ